MSPGFVARISEKRPLIIIFIVLWEIYESDVWLLAGEQVILQSSP